MARGHTAAWNWARMRCLPAPAGKESGLAFHPPMWARERRTDTWSSRTRHQSLQCRISPLDGSIGEQEPRRRRLEGAGLVRALGSSSPCLSPRTESLWGRGERWDMEEVPQEFLR